MQCSDCTNYKSGKGNANCLKCKKYINILKTSVTRQQITIDVITDTVLNNIPASNQTTTIYDAIRQLPLDLSCPLMMYCVLDANQREIANYLQISQQQASKKINFAIEIIKKMPIFTE